MNRHVLIILVLLISFSGLHAAPIKQYNVDQAISLFKQKHFDEALRHFRALLKSSKRKKQTVRIQWNVARCLEELGRYEESLTEFYGYQAIVRDAQRKKRAKAKIAKLIPKVYGSLKVTCSQDLSFSVRHEPTGASTNPEVFGPRKCPSTFKKLRAGRSKISAFHDGQTIERVALISPGVMRKVHLKPPPPKADNTLMVAGIITSAALVAGGIYLLSADDTNSGGTKLCFDCP